MEHAPTERGAVRIRAAHPQDGAAIAALLGDLGYPADPETAGLRVSRLNTDARSALFVAELGEAIVGLASIHRIPLFHKDGELARITSLVVAQNRRRRGVGTALLGACEAWAGKSGAERLELTSGDHRVDAHAFYELAGFEREGVRMTRWVAARP